MNSERWSRIGELFEAAALVPPAARDEWLRTACRGDDGLRSEVETLLRHDDEADREGFLPDPTPAGETGLWPSPTNAGGDEPANLAAQGDAFAPRPAIAATRRSRRACRRSTMRV